MREVLDRVNLMTKELDCGFAAGAGETRPSRPKCGKSSSIFRVLCEFWG